MRKKMVRSTKNQAVGIRLKEFRMSRGVTRHEMGVALNMRESRVYLLECGKARLTMKELEQIAWYFGVTTDAIVSGTVPMGKRDTLG